MQCRHCNFLPKNLGFHDNKANFASDRRISDALKRIFHAAKAEKVSFLNNLVRE